MSIRFVRFVDRYVGILLCKILCAVSPRSGDLPFDPGSIRRIVLLKFVGIGNLVLASPALAALRERFPDAHITFVTLSNNRRLLETNADVNQVFYFDASNLRSVFRSTWALLRHLRRERYDLLVDLEPYSRYTALVARLSGARWRVGFDTPRQARGGMFNLPVPYTNHAHMVEAFVSLAERAGAVRPARLALTPLCWSFEDDAAVESFLLQHGVDPARPLVGMHPGTGDNAPVRRWPPDRFARLADLLVEEYGVQVVFTGSPKEAPLVAACIQAMQRPAVDAAGRLSIPQLAGLVARCSLFVSGDTGPLHIAAATRTPVVGLYGPNTPDLYGPWGANHAVIYHNLPCSPCISNLNDKLTRCPHGQCIQSITVEEVTEVIRARYHALLRPEALVG